MAFNVSYIFQAIDNFSGVANTISGKMESLKKYSSSLAESLDKIGNKLQSLGSSLSLKVTAPLGIYALTALHAAAGQEKLNAQMENLIGNATQAKALAAQLESIKMTAPIDVGSVDDAALKLLVMGMSVEKVGDTINRFSKIAAGSGESLDNLVEMFAIAQSSPEGMSRALTTLGRRIPILEELQKVIKEKLGKDLTTKQIKQLAAEGKIDISVLEAALKRLTDQGGKFADSFGNQAKTLAGAFQILSNNFHRFQEAMGFAISKSVDLSGVIAIVNDVLKEVVHFVEEFAAEHPTITKYIVIFGAIAVALGPVLVALGTAIISLTALARILAVFTLNPFAIWGKTIFKLIAIFMYLYNTFSIVKTITDFLIGSFQSFMRMFPMLGQAVLFVGGAFIMLAQAGMLSQVLPPIFAAVRAAMFALNVAFAANPMGVMVVAVTALVAAIGYLLDKFGLLDGILTFIKDKALALADALKQVFSFDFSGITEAFSGIGSKISGFFGSSATQTTPLINSNIPLANTQTTESKSTVDINLKGNTGAVESVNSKTDGNTNLKLSQNMAYGGY
jgi:hypothetical protein